MISNISTLVRPNILAMHGYSSARDEYQGKDGIFLDANESPYGLLNRYPDPYQRILKQKLSEIKSVATENIFVGNGSDEAIDLLFRIFCRPTIDKVISFTPGYGMYQVSANIQDVEYIAIPLTKSFQINTKLIEPYLSDTRVKIIFVCSPNNPTGNILDTHDIEWLLQNFNGIVVIDEAYIDFADTPSWISKINQHKNLVILQTLSKAWGLAAARVGMAFTNPDIIALLNKVKPPYNVSSINQKEAIKALEHKKETDIRINAIKQERSRLQYEISKIDSVKKIYPSQTNFLLIEIEHPNAVYERLISQKIIVRNQSKKIKNGLRITIGSPKENNRLLNALIAINDEKYSLTEYGLKSSPDSINRH